MRVADRRAVDRQRAAAGVDERVRRARSPPRAPSAAVNGFSVDPGSKTSVSARLRMRSRACGSTRFGLNAGQFASARISPDLRVEDHESARFRLVLLDRRLQLAEGEVLQPRVDREREVAAGLRVADRGDVLDDVAAPVDDHATAAGASAEPRLLRELDAFLAGVVVAGEADDVPHHLAAGVVAAVLVLVVQPLDAQLERALGRVRRNPLREVHEVVGRTHALAAAPAASFREASQAPSIARARLRAGRETPKAT